MGAAGVRKVFCGVLAALAAAAASVPGASAQPAEPELAQRPAAFNIQPSP